MEGLIKKTYLPSTIVYRAGRMSAGYGDRALAQSGSAHRTVVFRGLTVPEPPVGASSTPRWPSLCQQWCWAVTRKPGSISER